MQMPLNLGALHFVGMGGIGMSAIAEVCLNMGYQVQGSDMSAGGNIDRLVARGAKAFIGHAAANVAGAGVMVVSSAIKRDNPELVAARELGLPIVLRADMLAELMRMKSSIAIAGTHGKTTTTSLLATVLTAGGVDPTVINGGIIEAFGSNARVGNGDWLVAEADESDGSFVRLPAQIGVITNIDPEHMENYGDFNGVMAAFKRFVLQLPFYGFCLAGIDHPNVRRLIEELKAQQGLSAPRILTYGEDASADVCIKSLETGAGFVTFDLALSDAMRGGARDVHGVNLPMPGRYNALNAAATFAVAHEIGVEVEAIRNGLGGFAGVRRRFTHVGSVHDMDFYDDYAHHPVEISSVLGAARATSRGKVIAVMQPHRYSRLKDHFAEFQACFDEADVVVMAPVYAAGEQPLAGFDHKSLGAQISQRGKSLRFIETDGDLVPLIREIGGPGDLVIGLGAGSISAWMNGLPEALTRVAA